MLPALARLVHRVAPDRLAVCPISSLVAARARRRLCWRVQPAESPLYDFPLGDESGYVVEGSATMELRNSGQSIEMKAGDLYEQAQDQRLPLDHPRHDGTPPLRG